MGAEYLHPVAQLCEVFELGGEVPFSDSLLECIVHGIDGSRGNDPPPGSGKPSRLERKLTLAVEFNNLAILVSKIQFLKTKSWNLIACLSI